MHFNIYRAVESTPFWFKPADFGYAGQNTRLPGNTCNEKMSKSTTGSCPPERTGRSVICQAHLKLTLTSVLSAFGVKITCACATTGAGIKMLVEMRVLSYFIFFVLLTKMQ